MKMDRLLSEMIKVDIAIEPQEIAGTGQMAISREFDMSVYRKALCAFLFSSSTLQAGDKIDIGVVDNSATAPSASGDLAALYLSDADNLMAFQHVTASKNVTAMTIDTTGAADGAITLNDLVFPYAAAPAVGTNEWNNDAALTAAINAAGIGITAAAPGANIVTLVSENPGEVTITFDGTVTAIVAADIVTTQAVAYIEVDVSDLEGTALRTVVDNPATNTGAVDVSCAILRGYPRYAPVPQAVAAP